MADPVEAFLKNTEEVGRLLEFHEEKTGTQRGRRYGVEILNKSAIVLLTACWEAFLEDTVAAAFQFILDTTEDPLALTKGIYQQAVKFLREEKNELHVWTLVGKGWKPLLASYQDQMLRSHLGFFNTPKASNVDNLFRAVLNLEDLSAHWTWRKMTSDGAKDRLETYIRLRGAIAHRVNAIQTVHKKDVEDYQLFLNRLAVRSANVTRDHVHGLVGKHPWERYRIGRFA